jgi:hypothetical protein
MTWLPFLVLVCCHVDQLSFGGQLHLFKSLLFGGRRRL